jgi:hypothetical protein
MYNVVFLAEEDNTEGSEHSPETAIEMKFTFNEMPTWMTLGEHFLSFLKANGYVFDYNARVSITSPEVPEEIPNDNEEAPF